MGPAAYRVRGGRARLQDQRGQAALDQVGGGGQPDRAGADDDDGQVCGGGCRMAVPFSQRGPMAMPGPLFRCVVDISSLPPVSTSVNIDVCRIQVAELPVLQDGPVAPCCPPITAGELSAADAEKMAAMFKALSDPVRLRLFSKIASHPGGEACVCDIQDVGVSQPTVSHHLKKPGHVRRIRRTHRRGAAAQRA